MKVLNHISVPVKELAVYELRNVSIRAVKKAGDGGNGTERIRGLNSNNRTYKPRN
jgi:hypothetical protein